jgi:hypothetical protein
VDDCWAKARGCRNRLHTAKASRERIFIGGPS